jgi:large subunit ribosomal protein L17
MLRNLVKALILKQSIITTAARAKEAKRYAERIITFAMKGDGNAHRRVFRALADKKCVKRLFADIIPQLAKHPSGHLRIIRTGQRKGDGADMVLIEFIFAQGKGEKKEKGKKKVREKPKAQRRIPRLGRRKKAEKGKKEEEKTEEAKDKKKEAKKKTKAKTKTELKEKPKTRVKKAGKIRKKT